MINLLPEKKICKYRYLTGVLFVLLQSTAFSQSDNGATPTTILSSTGVFNYNGILTGSTYTAGTGLPGCGGTGQDVWYQFVANSSNPTITLTQTSGAAGLRRSQLFSGTWGSLVSLACSGNSNTLVAAGLTPGQTYIIRVYTNTAGSFFNFTLSITDPHNLCGSAVTLSSATTCNNTPGNMYGATLTALTITAPDCATGVTRDIWYRFVAQTNNPTITLSGLGVNFLSPGIQLLSNNCGGTFTTYFCGTTSISANYLVPGTTYFIRVYTTSAISPASPVGCNFNICITDPVTPPPVNDECAGAINLPISISCSNVPGNIAGATPSAVAVAPCTGPVTYDVWYKFKAVSASSTINLSSIGGNFTNTRMQLFSGTCSALTSLACGTTTITNATTAGTVYYVRVYSTTAGTAPNGNARFNICVSGANAPVRFGNSYVNITRKTAGGLVQNGDILEIRMTINHTSGTMTNLRFVDNIPTNTAIATAPGHNGLKVITNEGLTYKSYTQATGDDAATYNASPPPGQYNIRMNLGFGSSNPGIPTDNTGTEFTSATGSMNAGADRPRGGGGMIFAVAYRVVVTGATGSIINLNPCQFIYRNGGGDITLTGTPFQILIDTPIISCQDANSVNIASEFGGTFGSGTAPNRSTNLSIPIDAYTFISDVNDQNQVGDGRYAIIKNMSPRNRTIRTARRQPSSSCNATPTLNINDPLHCNNRMFGGHWYIDGDHTGTTNSIGNNPPDYYSNGGYMLMVNADYVASEIYRQELDNLCPNTYYDFSAWVRNICPTCGIDSTGAQFTGSVTAPANGYPGVYPNLTFSLDGVDYYNTGEIDTVGWLRRGFVFRTGNSQTSAVFSIRNNSQGGGGNDWVLDDVAVATCYPNMAYFPSSNPNVCENDVLVVRDTVRSLFNNYTFYKWQYWSAATSGPWVDIAGASGTATPVFNPGTNMYEFVESYSIPPGFTTPANSGDRYRLVVASTLTSLSNDCAYTEPTPIQINVISSCGPPLQTTLVSFNGRLNGNSASLIWATSREDEPIHFTLEKSEDGIRFRTITTVSGYNNPATETNEYRYTDPTPVNEKTVYRLTMTNVQGLRRAIRTVFLDPEDKDGFRFINVINPFSNELSCQVLAPSNGMILVDLVNQSGRIIKTQEKQVNKGVNAIQLNNMSLLPDAIYILRIHFNERVLFKKVVKISK